MKTVGEVLAVLEAFAPYTLAESWDNCGMLVGDRTQTVDKVLCALDVTQAVVEEAVQVGAQLIVAHHPLIFTSMSRVTQDDATGRMVRAAIAANIAVICMHTNADCAQGGVNDALASVLELTNVVSMEAGENGCLGRVGDLQQSMQPQEFAAYVKTKLQAGGVRFVQGTRPITRVAVGGGACGKMMDAACAKGADAFVIGDSSYDIMQRAQICGITLCDAGHFPTENPVVPVFAKIITTQFPQIEAIVSAVHEDCIHFI